MDDHQDRGGGSSRQDTKVTSFVARTLLVREGFPRIGWRGGKPVIIDDADGVTRIYPVHAVASADQNQRSRERILVISRALEEARSPMLARGDLVAARAYVEDALAIAAEMLKELAP